MKCLSTYTVREGKAVPPAIVDEPNYTLTVYGKHRMSLSAQGLFLNLRMVHPQKYVLLLDALRWMGDRWKRVPNVTGAPLDVPMKEKITMLIKVAGWLQRNHIEEEEAPNLAKVVGYEM